MEHTGRFAAYYRASTDEQGRSGLGLEAQRKAVLDYLNGGRWDLVAEFTEVETGKGRNALVTRPQLAAHLASWAKICPGNHESAGKRLSGRTGRGNAWLRAILVECAWSASRSKQTYLAAQFRRITRRRGPKKAVLAVAHSILVAVYYILRDGVAYRELGGDYFDRLGTTRLLRYHIRRLEELGHRVTLDPVAARRPS